MVIQECADVLSVIAAVESGRGVAVVGEFITAVAGDRVRFVPFVSGAHFQEVGLVYRQSGLGEMNYLSRIPTVRTALHQAAEELKRHLKQLKCPYYLPAGLAISFTTISKAYD